MLQSDFVLGWKNIRREDYVGYSSGYSPAQHSVGTTNGAGPRNTQLVVMTPDLVVLHALPGFWHPEDLARELRFAQQIDLLWGDQGKSRETKERMFKRMHRREVYTQSAETYARSTWQGFDARVEQSRLRTEYRDTVLRDQGGAPVLGDNGMPRMKPINVLVHERMAARPFKTWSEFDIEEFVDYGKLHYDNNRFEKSRREFAGQDALRRKRARNAVD